MKRLSTSLAGPACLSILLASTALAAAEEKKAAVPGSNIVAIYHVAPGKHLDFLKWMAARDAVAAEAGAPGSMWYAHTDGAGWDYLSITPEVDASRKAEMDKKLDAISKQKGLSTGFKASLEFRQFIADHSDTFAIGPMSAGELVRAAEK